MSNCPSNFESTFLWSPHYYNASQLPSFQLLHLSRYHYKERIPSKLLWYLTKKQKSTHLFLEIFTGHKTVGGHCDHCLSYCRAYRVSEWFVSILIVPSLSGVCFALLLYNINNFLWFLNNFIMVCLPFLGLWEVIMPILLSSLKPWIIILLRFKNVFSCPASKCFVSSTLFL